MYPPWNKKLAFLDAQSWVCHWNSHQQSILSHPTSYFIFSAAATTPLCVWLPPGVNSDQLLLQIWGSFGSLLFRGWLATSLTHIQLLVHLPWSTPAQKHCALQQICAFKILMWITINFLWRMSDTPGAINEKGRESLMECFTSVEGKLFSLGSFFSFYGSTWQ